MLVCCSEQSWMQQGCLKKKKMKQIEMGFCLPVKCSINLSFMLMSLGTISETDRQKDSVNVFVLMYHSI